MARPVKHGICRRCGSERVRVRGDHDSKFAPCGVCEFREQRKILDRVREKKRRTA